MNKLLGILESIWIWTYFFGVVLLRLFRIISKEQLHKLLFGGSDGFEDEDVKITRSSRKS